MKNTTMTPERETKMMRWITTFGLVLALSACGAVYHSPKVRDGVVDGTRVRVVPIDAETTRLANRSTYRPRGLPSVFTTGAGGGSGLRTGGAAPQPVLTASARPGPLESRLPPNAAPGPYTIGISDVVLLATPRSNDSVTELTGLLAAQNARQGYTVQDDGAIAIPNVGRVRIAGMTVEEAENALFQRLVESQIDPTFSLEIAEFNARRVAVGGAVGKPGVVPVALSPLYLDEALATAGGINVADEEYAAIRIYRDGTLYQIPLSAFNARSDHRRIRLVNGDSVFVDTEYDLGQAQDYFEQQIALANFRSSQRQAALGALSTEIAIRRNALTEARQNYLARADLGAIKRDHVYITGEVKTQSRFTLPFEQQSTLADALFEAAEGVPVFTGNVRQIYVLRASNNPAEFGAVTAWHLDAGNAANFTLAAQFELRPNDVIFVAEQPVTRWNRVIRQVTPSLITTSISAASN